MPGGAAITVTGNVDGTNATFTLPYAISNEDIYVDRLHQRPGVDYTLSSTTLTFLAGAIPQPNTVGGTDAASLHIDVFGFASTATSAGTTSKNGFLTAGNIINRVAVQCGLASVTDPYASTDQNFIQLRELLNYAGLDLLGLHDWAHLIKETTIVTAGAGVAYVLPSDFDRVVDQTQWNRSTRLPMIGPLSGPEVQYIKARLTGVLVQVAYRIQGNVITFPTAPSDGATLAFEYVSGNWVWSASGSQGDSTTAVATGDTVLYDPDMAMAALRLAFLDAKGFDTNSAMERYKAKLAHAKAKNVAGRMLNLGGIGINVNHLIDAQNLPITGYGQ